MATTTILKKTKPRDQDAERVSSFKSLCGHLKVACTPFHLFRPRMKMVHYLSIVSSTLALKASYLQ